MLSAVAYLAFTYVALCVDGLSEEYLRGAHFVIISVSFFCFLIFCSLSWLSGQYTVGRFRRFAPPEHWKITICYGSATNPADRLPSIVNDGSGNRPSPHTMHPQSSRALSPDHSHNASPNAGNGGHERVADRHRRIWSHLFVWIEFLAFSVPLASVVLLFIRCAGNDFPNRFRF
jgi:hypothetical protein